MRIFLAEGQHRTLVGRRPPTVSGPCDHLELGSVTIVRPRELPAGSPPVGFAIPRIAGWRIFGRSPADYRMLSAKADREDMRRAADATIVALSYWPSVSSHVPLADPSPTLATSLWDLAGVLTERDRVRVSWTRLTGVGRGLPGGSSIRAEAAQRVERARHRLTKLNDDVRTRLEHLGRLADETEAFVRRQRALDEARAVLRDADYLMDTGEPAPLPGADTAEDLADHTSAVLAAYRELTT